MSTPCLCQHRTKHETCPACRHGAHDAGACPGPRDLVPGLSTPVLAGCTCHEDHKHKVKARVFGVCDHEGCWCRAIEKRYET